MTTARPVQPVRPEGTAPAQVWYAAYGSNMHMNRLMYYLGGGQPPGAARSYPGCRDSRPPALSVPVELRGALYFATESPVWTGGRAFYDPHAMGRLYARAHLVSAEQFSDIAAQEMHREPGTDLDLTEVLRDGVATLGRGPYETLVCPGSLDGIPLLTFTAPWTVGEAEWTSPSAAYLRHLARGLLEAGAWDVPAICTYLQACPGAAGHWNAHQIADLLAQ
ncbi:histone deacetylase [Streptomyces sp. RKAG293]|uniref:histone deacetylase n=1 Tax=Streptomyces sp. RKAG293 TaxID=2893403 RepID=UPI002033AF18|nr:histone deacetylase [Streptomyces sp. RKAG293]MCM2423980.1 histone deacetylase [Streptomyces sp. RKAG293]